MFARGGCVLRPWNLDRIYEAQSVEAKIAVIFEVVPTFALERTTPSWACSISSPGSFRNSTLTCAALGSLWVASKFCSWGSLFAHRPSCISRRRAIWRWGLARLFAPVRLLHISRGGIYSTRLPSFYRAIAFISMLLEDILQSFVLASEDD